MSTQLQLRAPHEVAPRAVGTRQPLGIERGNYVALKAGDPETAAAFAAEHLGFSLVHVDSEGRHYLAAHGPDRYSLVYVQGDGEPGVDHASYVVRDLATLDRAARLLEERGVRIERVTESPLWSHAPAVRFSAPNGTTLELTVGVHIPVPLGEHVPPPAEAVAPLGFDHLILRHADVHAGNAFAHDVLGLTLSGQIVRPDGEPFLTFWRAGVLFHCLGTHNAGHDGLHHVQFSVKNDRAVFRAYEQMREQGAVEILWGPLRHGCGQAVVVYLLDTEGHVIEFSAEEELILDAEAYEVQRWPIEDPHAGDEWSDTNPPEVMR